MVAFVVGIGGYHGQRTLANPVQDATAVSRLLESQNVDVIAALDCDANELGRRFESFEAALRPGDAALLFFAGRGTTINNSVRLVAISDAGKPDIEKDAVNLEVLVGR